MTRVTRGMPARLALLAVGLGLWIAPATAQPTAAQQEAIKSSCRSDYMSNCMSVKPGGIEALQCLERNMSKLSGACKSAVTAATAKAEPAAAPAAAAPVHTPPAQQAAPAAPAPAPATAAAPAHTTPAPAASKPAAGKPAAAARPAAKPAPSAAAAAPAQPTQAQQNAIRSACPNDFRSKCAGVSPGGEAALACLKKNEAALSAACKTAVSAIGGAAPAAAPASGATAAAAPAAAAPAVAAPVATPVPVFPPLMEARILRRFCTLDFETLCKGVPLGQGRALQCLAQNTPALSPGCRQAMATATR